MSTRLHVLVHGTVHGVGFRRATERSEVTALYAPEHGTLEAALEGEPAAVDRVLELLRTGPPGAHVTDVEVEEVPRRDERSFTVR